MQEQGIAALVLSASTSFIIYGLVLVSKRALGWRGVDA